MDDNLQIPVNKLYPWSPFKWFVWPELTKPLRPSEVKTAIKAASYYNHPHTDTPIHWTRAQHIQRVAYLVEFGWNDAIDIDVGIPSMGFFPKWSILDGNHRLAAAIFRKDKFIEAAVSGCCDYMEELFGVTYSD